MAGRTVMIQQAADLLLEGASGAEVRERINTRYKTLGSQKYAISLVRKRVMELYEPDLTPMRQFEAEAGVTDFIKAPLSEKAAIQRRHTYEQEWSLEAEECLQRLELIPPSMSGFGLTHAEVIRYKRESAQALRRKNANVIVIKQPGLLLETAVAMLQTSDTSHSVGRIVLPLLLVSGRRSAEILNGKSTFEPAPNPYYCYFTGQLKTKGRAKGRYMIPLLCPFATFCIGLNALRQKEGDVSNLGGQQINSRYQVKLNDEFQRDTLPHLPASLPERKITVHDLRAMYAAMVFHCYTVCDTFNLMCMRVCGHDDMTESLAYNSIRLEGGDELRGRFGALHLV